MCMSSTYPAKKTKISAKGFLNSLVIVRNVVLRGCNKEMHLLYQELREVKPKNCTAIRIPYASFLPLILDVFIEIVLSNR